MRSTSSYMLARYMLSTCVCPSVTRRYCVQTAKCKITQTTPYDIPGILVFCRQKSRRNSNGVTPTGASNKGGVGSNGDFYPQGASYARVLAVVMCLCVCVCACVCVCCVSVCLSVTCRYCIKTAKRRITQTTPRNSPETVVGGRAPSPGICAQSDPPPFRTLQLQPTSAHSASTVRACEKKFN